MTCETHTNPTIAFLKSHLKLENWVEKLEIFPENTKNVE